MYRSDLSLVHCRNYLLLDQRGDVVIVFWTSEVFCIFEADSHKLDTHTESLARNTTATMKKVYRRQVPVPPASGSLANTRGTIRWLPNTIKNHLIKSTNCFF
jgi:hypothetical protein